MNDNDMRDALYRAVYEEFVGPIDPFSEEKLPTKGDGPKQKYYAAALYPLGVGFEEFTEPTEEDGSSASMETEHASSTAAIKIGQTSLADDEEPIALSNSDFQSAMSMTVSVQHGDSLVISINAATYETVTEGEASYYQRRPIVWRTVALMPPSPSDRIQTIRIPDTKLAVMLVYRYESPNGAAVITVALRNTNESKDPRHCDVKSCYFQCGFTLHSSLGFKPLPEHANAASMSLEELSNMLIYSEIRNYAIGHGCATDWSEEEPLPLSISTAAMPISEVHPTLPIIKELSDTSFDMFVFQDENRWMECSSAIERLCNAYSNWINALTTRAKKLSGWKLEAAKANIEDCKECLQRIRNGYSILCENSQARRAFQLANEAMLSQHLHYRVVANEATEIEEPREKQRGWRPFQLAFILANIESIVDPTSSDRSLLDLIWFPTGGGKTEAYLGLSAFVLILERLNGESCDGTTVLMRYTLRLLSSQQFQRAASLICALEMMRKRDENLLGSKRFSIGFWVGSDAAPNNWDQAMKCYKSLEKKELPKKPIPVTQCPWCGEKMGAKSENGNLTSGYKKTTNRDKRRKADKNGRYLRFECPNKDCDFSNRNNDLPLVVVDDEIYLNPPSILLGTVDKFANITYRPESYRIFGISESGERTHSPKLIIQDELHLISGPLGSMTAHYETLIENLCTFTNDDGDLIRPKIIASTATISRAKEQCRELFASKSSEIKQFPPSGISHEDSFFASLDKSGDGRRYVGINLPNLSYAFASIRLYKQLLWEPATWELEADEDRDPYWTVVGYYSSTRELGQAVTWTTSDIPERLNQMRKENPESRVRYLNNPLELTGRKSSAEVTSGLEQLTVKYPEKSCIDLCLATNMISVGLDVPRLGTMVIAGQPKETSEYIQCSSRVGRGSNKGIVFVLYGNTRPRDRSHYENFKGYHQSFYKYVKPSSVTAFCQQVRNRAMAGTLFGLYRSSNPGMALPNNPDSDALDWARDTILSRVELVDPTESPAAEEQIDEIVYEWESQDFDRWSSLNPEPFRESDAPLPLMHPLGGKTHPQWDDFSFEVPISLRSVDEECKVHIIGRYDEFTEHSDEED